MQKSGGYVLRRCLALLLLASFFFVTGANAEGGGGESLYHKLEPFTVNLSGLERVIQVRITLKLANAEVGSKVSLYLPAIRNQMILLLSEKTGEELQTLDGKNMMIKEAKKALNKTLGLKAKHGISQVLLESIIIQ